MERLKMMKNCIMSQIESQMGDLRSVNTEELGQAIDMIKDLEEAMYYCSIVKAMEEKEPPYYSDMENDTMYYTEGGRSNGRMSSNMSSSGGSRTYTERHMPINFKDDKEGRSPRYRRMYMESKEMHQPQEEKMKDLEKYMQELSSDITEMIEDATPEEKEMLKKKITILATKING